MSGPLAWHRFETLSDASEALAEAVAIGLREAIERRGSASLAVPGGKTPAGFLAALGAQDLAWDKVLLMPTDERFVPRDDPASNERMIRAAFAPLADGRAQFLSFHDRGETLENAADALSRELSAVPPLDILVSGMGADGHIASLFPGDEAALSAPASAEIVPGRPQDLPPRLSLSSRRLAEAGWAALLIAGADKAEALASAQELPGAFPVGLLLSRAQGLDVYWAKA